MGAVRVAIPRGGVLRSFDRKVSGSRRRLEHGKRTGMELVDELIPKRMIVDRRHGRTLAVGAKLKPGYRL